MSALRQQRPQTFGSASSDRSAAAVQLSPGGPLSQHGTPSSGGSRFDQQLMGSSPQGGPLQLKGDKDKDKGGGGGGAGTASGLANYESTLGKWLGSKLYAAVSDQLTLDKLAGYAESGLKGALGPLGDYIKDADADADPAQVDKAMAALKGALGKEASKFVKANGAGLQKALQGFVDASPELIVLIGLLAAAGAVAANMKIPELKAKLGITDGLDLELSAKIGKLRDITLEKIQAKLILEAGSLKATAVVAYEDEDMKARLDLRYGLTDDLDLTGSGTWDEEKGYGGRLGMEYKPNDRLSIGAHVGYDEDKGANAGVGVTLRF